MFSDCHGSSRYAKSTSRVFEPEQKSRKPWSQPKVQARGATRSFANPAGMRDPPVSERASSFRKVRDLVDVNQVPRWISIAIIEAARLVED